MAPIAELFLPEDFMQPVIDAEVFPSADEKQYEQHDEIGSCEFNAIIKYHKTSFFR